MKDSFLTVALVGNPNAGKSSVFNRLTGMNQKVGNFPGVTVERKVGFTQLANRCPLRIMDLPGTYSLHPTSMDETIVLQALTDKSNPAYPDVVFYIADMTNLERQLLLLSQVMCLGFPVALGLTMPDVAEEQGISVDAALLQKELNIPVFVVNGRSGDGLAFFKEWLEKDTAQPATPFVKSADFAPRLVKAIQSELPNTEDYAALLVAHHYARIGCFDEAQRDAIAKRLEENDFKSLPLQVEETLTRFDKIVPLVRRVVKSPNNNKVASATFSDKLDRILTHKVWGSLIFLGLLLLIFQATFDWASYPMGWIEEGFGWLQNTLKDSLPPSFLTSLLTDGIVAGLGGILIFVPQIAILFLFIAILEESGYMARAVYLSDSLMQRFGLNGRSIVSIFSGMACAVPAIMATRTIGSWKDRLITIMVTPLVACSARIPVFTVLVAFVVPAGHRVGIFNLQGLFMLGLYLLGIFSALGAAWVLKFFMRTRELSFLAMELPDYKQPDWKNVAISVTNKVKAFAIGAGKIILTISIGLWLLSSFSPHDREETIAQARVEAQTQQLDSLATEDFVASRLLENSYMGYLGHGIEPAIRPLGFDWKIGIALIASFAAREVFVGTMATIYSVGSSADDDTPLREKMAKATHAKTGKPVFTPAAALSLLLFYVYAMQCMSTFAVVRRETNSWFYPIVQFVAMTAFAYFLSLAVFQIWG